MPRLSLRVRLVIWAIVLTAAAVAAANAFAQTSTTPYVGNGNTSSGQIIYAPVGTCTTCVPLPTTSSGSGSSNANIVQFGGNNVVTGTGAGGLGIPRVTVSNDSVLASIGAITGAFPAGTNIIGKVGIDQTTPGTTNGVVIAPTSAAAAGITSGQSGSAGSSLVLKASAGNLYGVYASNLTATSGFLMVFNATSAPADGAVTPIDCVPMPANGNTSINYAGGGPPEVFSTGITAVVSSNASCFTKTTGVITAFIHGFAQ